MSKQKLGWILALSLPGILILWFIATFIFYIVGSITENNLELLNAIKSFINYILGFLSFFSIITTPIGIVLLAQENNFVSEAITTGWKATKKYFWILMLLGGIVYLPSLISNLFSIVVDYIPGATEMVWNEMRQMEVTQPTGPRSIVIAIVFAISSFFGARLGLGLVKTNFMILKDKKPIIKDLCVPFRYVLRLIGGGILVGLATLIGFVALIIPGIYISIRLSMFKYFIAEGYGAIDAIKASWAITEGNIWNLICISFVYFGIAVLGVLALGFGLLWAIPTVMLTQAYVYTQLKHNLPHDLKPIH